MARRRRGTGSPQKEVRGGAARLLAHPAAFFSSRSGASAEGATNEAQVDLLYRQIGQLKVENDFLARKLGN